MKDNNEQTIFERYDSLESKLINLGKEVLLLPNSRNFTIDHFLIGVINRSLSLTYGFKTLLTSNNYIGAVHLIRPHLDTFLRLFAVALVDDFQDFCTKTMQSVQINTMVDRNNKKMSDTYLQKRASEYYPWIKNVYEKTSGFVHFSESHIFTSGQMIDNKLIHKISKFDKFVPEVSRIEASEAMIKITEVISLLVDGWIQARKENKRIDYN